MITNDSASGLVVPIVSVLPVAPACLTSFLALGDVLGQHRRLTDLEAAQHALEAAHGEHVDGPPRAQVHP